MPFEKGHKKLGGRKKGIPNKSTTQIRELLNSVLQEEIERVPEYFNAITDPKQRLDALAKLLPFIVPKMQSIKEVKQEDNHINKIEVEIIRI